MSDLIAWLTQILNEDEAGAKTAATVNGSAEWTESENADYVYTVTTGNAYPVACGAYGYMVDGTRHFIARHDPAAVLADIKAKRARIALHGPVGDGVQHCDVCRLTYPCRTLRLEASAYAGRPGYDEGWKP